MITRSGQLYHLPADQKLLALKTHSERPLNYSKIQDFRIALQVREMSEHLPGAIISLIVIFEWPNDFEPFRPFNFHDF